jgi:hypothetical protein
MLGINCVAEPLLSNWLVEVRDLRAYIRFSTYTTNIMAKHCKRIYVVTKVLGTFWRAVFKIRKIPCFPKTQTKKRNKLVNDGHFFTYRRQNLSWV